MEGKRQTRVKLCRRWDAVRLRPASQIILVADQSCNYSRRAAAASQRRQVRHRLNEPRPSCPHLVQPVEADGYSCVVGRGRPWLLMATVQSKSTFNHDHCFTPRKKRIGRLPAGIGAAPSAKARAKRRKPRAAKSPAEYSGPSLEAGPVGSVALVGRAEVAGGALALSEARVRHAEAAEGVGEVGPTACRRAQRPPHPRRSPQQIKCLFRCAGCAVQ